MTSFPVCIVVYENDKQVSETGSIVDCDSYSTVKPLAKIDESCRFDISKNFKGSSCFKQVSYGFQDGQPCVLLKVNKVTFMRVRVVTTAVILVTTKDSSKI